MTLVDLFRDTLGVDDNEPSRNEPTPDSRQGVREVRLDSMGLSMWKAVAVLELLGVERSHRTINNGRTISLKVKRTRQRSRKRVSRTAH